MARQILTEEKLEKLLLKKTKGFVSELTRVTVRLLKENTASYLYGQNHVQTKKKTYKNTKGVLASITSESTQNTGESFYNRVYFDVDVMEGYASKKTHSSLGTYTDVHGNFVGDELIEDLWLEDGTDGGLVPRSGADMIKITMEQINDWLASSDVDFYFESELGDIIIERFK